MPAPIGLARRCPVEVTTSSSSAANAEEPRVPLGLGERRLGEPDPELAFSPELDAIGRAIGARGRVMGPGPEPSVCACIFIDPRRPWPGASIDGPGVGGTGVRGVLGFGGPIGEGTPGAMPIPLPMGTPMLIGIPRLKVGSNDGPLLKVRDRPEGVIGLPGG